MVRQNSARPFFTPGKNFFIKIPNLFRGSCAPSKEQPKVEGLRGRFYVFGKLDIAEIPQEVLPDAIEHDIFAEGSSL